MAAMMLSVGYGDTSLEELSAMVNAPTNVAEFRQQHIFDIPPYGLYLTDVMYKESGKFYIVWYTVSLWINKNCLITYLNEW